MNIFDILAIIVGAFLVGYLFSRQFLGKKKPPSPYTSSPATMTSYTSSSATMAPSAPDSDEILRLLQAGRKIEAIKLYRTQTGAGLKEAKDAVDRMEADQIYGSTSYQSMTSQSITSTEEVQSPFQSDLDSSSPSSGWNDELRSLIRSGRKISAIKLYREKMNVGLKEAKDVIDGLQEEMMRGN